MTRAEDVFSK